MAIFLVKALCTRIIFFSLFTHTYDHPHNIVAFGRMAELKPLYHVVDETMEVFFLLHLLEKINTRFMVESRSFIELRFLEETYACTTVWFLDFKNSSDFNFVFFFKVGFMLKYSILNFS